MKKISTELQNLLNSEVTNTATCLLIILKDNSLLGFTSHDEDLEIDGINYNSNSGLELDKYSEDLSLKNDKFKTLSVLDSNYISEDDIISGRFDGAKIELFLVDFLNISLGKISLKKGYISKIINEGGKFNAEIESLSSKLKREITEIYSPLCRAKFGDEKCGFDKNSSKVTGTITSKEDNRKFTDSTRSEDTEYFDYGVIKFLSGDNSGLQMEIKTFFTGGVFELVLPFAKDIEVGDNYELYTGCDKRFSSCKNKFSNAENFRGFPHIPGTDNLLKGAN